jgi:hypothetical protein
MVVVVAVAVTDDGIHAVIAAPSRGKTINLHSLKQLPDSHARIISQI